jgi:HEPN domain-containing protein
MTKDREEYIKNWLFRANEDIAVINSLVKAGAEYYTSSISFHAQLASEKFLKAFLVYHNIDFPRTHDLDYLLLECQKINKVAFQIDFKSLTDFGVSVRYPDDFYIPDEKEA